MKLKAIMQQLGDLKEQFESGEVIDSAILSDIKSVLQDKKIACKHKLRHRVDFAKRERTEKKLKKVKAGLKQLKALQKLISD